MRLVRSASTPARSAAATPTADSAAVADPPEPPPKFDARAAADDDDEDEDADASDDFDGARRRVPDRSARVIAREIGVFGRTPGFRLDTDRGCRLSAVMVTRMMIRTVAPPR